MKKTVEVLARSYELDVIQISKNVWVATGEFEGKRIQQKGRTAQAACKSWTDVANMKSVD